MFFFKIDKNISLKSILFLLFSLVNCSEDNSEQENRNETEIEESVRYKTPSTPTNSYFFETFDDGISFEKKWVISSAKKDDVDKDVAKYDGIWLLEPLEENPLIGDMGLVLKSKAKHAAISAKLTKPFSFKSKPLVVQYEVNHQNGQECGGSYIKLLSETSPPVDLSRINDKTPYTIMFGPDKCGNVHKLHFIFRHVNPITKAVEEKHCKRPEGKLEAQFKDKKIHLYTLIVRPDNSFEIMLDHQKVNSGNLLEDFTPPVNPYKEIDDPNDVKPADWDDREKIPDPSAVKPADWDEDAPRQIVDQFAEKPEGWLEEESEHMPDPTAVKPDDWDNEMDGEWEAPLIPNPKCSEAPGCGKWKRPTIDNPNYKGKWKAPLLDNPNYKGKWAPRKIHNPDFFEDLEPFKMTPISGIGIELWSMSDNIYFDNFLITDDIDEARLVAAETFDLKVAKNENLQKSWLTTIVEYSSTHPWIYGVYVLVLAIPVVLIFVCCCADDAKSDADALRKKTDEPEKDDEASEILDKKDEEASEISDKKDDDNDDENIITNDMQDESDHKLDDEVVDSKSDSDFEKSDEDNQKSDEDNQKSDEDNQKSDEDNRKSPRLRKFRKE